MCALQGGGRAMAAWVSGQECRRRPLERSATLRFATKVQAAFSLAGLALQAPRHTFVPLISLFPSLRYASERAPASSPPASRGAAGCIIYHLLLRHYLNNLALCSQFYSRFASAHYPSKGATHRPLDSRGLLVLGLEVRNPVE